MKTFSEYMKGMITEASITVPEQAYYDTVKTEDFIKAIEDSFHKFFPKSFIKVQTNYLGEVLISPRLALNNQEKGKYDLLGEYDLEGSFGEIYFQSGKKFVMGSVKQPNEVKDKTLADFLFRNSVTQSLNVYLHHRFNASSIRVKSDKSTKGFVNLKVKDSGVECGVETYKKNLENYFKKLKMKLDKLYKEDKFTPEHKELWEKKGY